MKLRRVSVRDSITLDFLAKVFSESAMLALQHVLGQSPRFRYFLFYPFLRYFAFVGIADVAVPAAAIDLIRPLPTGCSQEVADKLRGGLQASARLLEAMPAH